MPSGKPTPASSWSVRNIAWKPKSTTSSLQRASRDDKADFMTPEMRRFFNAIARVMYDAGYLRLSFDHGRRKGRHALCV
ncbi:MAG: hypothetical protein R2838_17270 [Caldilineaceae bacterium]